MQTQRSIRVGAQRASDGGMVGRMALQRIVLDFRSEAGGELVLRVLYRSQDGPNPGTKARAREVVDLTRTGLRDALEALDAGDVTVGGTSGFSVREDILNLPQPDEARRAAS
jgi:hypothetical protein